MSATIESEIWGHLDGQPVRRWTMRNRHGLVLRAIELGTIVTELHVPDASGTLADVVLGRASLDDYAAGHPYFGCTVGRCANRIAFGRLPVEGRLHRLACNAPPHHLHGGQRGFDKMLWSGGGSWTEHGPELRFQRESPHREEGYPGTLTMTIRYRLTEANAFEVDMTATTDKTTVVNLAHHTYWNLAGHASGSILDHELRLHAKRFTPVDATLIPTGDIVPVDGTPLDFRAGKPVRRDLPATGYDHNFVVDGNVGLLRPAAVLTDPASGRVMTLWTDQPGLQLYSGHLLDGIAGKDGAVYGPYAGVCLETQLFPDAPNKAGRPGWPEPLLWPGQTYRHRMIHRFSTVGGPPR